MASTMETVGRVHIWRIGERVRSLWLHESSSWVNWQLCLLDDLLQHSIPCEQLLQLYTPPSSTMCSEGTAKGFISMQVAHLVAIWPTLALPLQILVDNTFPGVDVLSSIIHSTERIRALAMSQDFFYGAGCLNRGLQFRLSPAGPPGWSFKCIKVWDSTLVHLDTVVLLVNNLNCCFNVPIFFSMNPAACGL